MTVAGLLLAAGGGRRFGGPKALARLDGELLVERGVHLLAEGGCAPVVVVLGAAADTVLAAAELDGARVVRNAGWKEGMGSSLRAGLAALSGLPAAEAAVVALADQPLIGPEAVRRLVAAWRERPGTGAAIATYGGQPRNPVLLDRSIWSAAAERAVGDVGARGLLRDRARVAYDATVLAVPCDGTGSPVDIDTPEQLAALQQKEQPCS